MVQPCRKYAKTAKFSTILMREDVVRIVRSGAEILKRANRNAAQKFARYRAILSIRFSRNALQQPVEIRLAYFRFLVHSKLAAIEKRDVVLGHVVAERVKELRGNDFSRSRHLRILRRIELDEVDITTSITHAKTGCDAFGLCRNDNPGLFERWPLAVVRAFRQVGQAHPADTMPALKPAAVRHFAHRVDVHCRGLAAVA